MRAIFILTVTVAIIYSAKGEESKQHILVDGIQNDDECPDSSIDLKFKVSKVDRTTYKLNGKAEYKEEITKDMTVEVTVYKQQGPNRYGPTPYGYKGNLCETVDSDTEFFPKIAKSGDLPTVCPYPKGTYSVNDAVIIYDKLPPGVEQGCYKANIRILKGVEKRACYNVMFRITDKEGKAPSKCQK